MPAFTSFIKYYMLKRACRSLLVSGPCVVTAAQVLKYFTPSCTNTAAPQCTETTDMPGTRPSAWLDSVRLGPFQIGRNSAEFVQLLKLNVKLGSARVCMQLNRKTYDVKMSALSKESYVKNVLYLSRLQDGFFIIYFFFSVSNAAEQWIQFIAIKKKMYALLK